MRPLTQETLGLRRGVSATSIRTQCNEGKLQHFRLERPYRIPAAIVEEIEQCQTLPSDVSEADTAFSGVKTGSEDVISLRHVPERNQSQKPQTFTAARPSTNAEKNQRLHNTSVIRMSLSHTRLTQGLPRITCKMQQRS